MFTFDEIKASMSWLERIAALKLIWWARREGPKMLNRMVGNWQTSLIGFILALFGQLQVGVPTTMEEWLKTAMNALMAALGLVAKDASTGSQPGTTH